MSKCEISMCGREMDSFHPTKERTDGILVQVLSTGRAYLVCDNCAKKLGLVKV